MTTRRLMCLTPFLAAALSACAPSTDEVSFDATDTAGQSVDLASLRGEVVLLNAWATWCKPCRQEIPFLATLQQRERANGLRVVGVSIDAADDRERVIEAAPQLGIAYDIWLDPEDRIATLTGTTAVPASVLIDREGRLRWRHVGVVREETPGFAEALRGALEER